MGDIILQIPFEKLGWVSAQTLWISTVYLTAIILVWKILGNLNPKFNYNIGLGAILSLPFIPALLFVEHHGILPPIGLANWELSQSSTTAEPVIQGLPQFTGVDLAAFIPSLYYWLGVVWTIVACLLLGYVLYTVISLYFYLQNRPNFDDKTIQSDLDDLATELGVASHFKVKKCEESEGPAVAGLIRPFVLLPTSLSDHYNSEEINVLLLHELMHIKRKDYFFALLQQLICSLFFFQPLIWWLNKKLNRQREVVCDREVTQITQDSYTYGSTLLKLKVHTQTVLSHSLHITDHNLIQRIQQLKNVQKQEANFSLQLKQLGISFLVLGIALFSTAWNSYHLHYSHNKSIQSETSYIESNTGTAPHNTVSSLIKH